MTDTQNRPLTGRTALITGSEGGLGLVLAESLAAAGADIALNGLRDDAEGARLAQDLADTHGIRAAYIGADVGQRDQVTRLVDSTAARLAPADIVVNNAVIRHFAPVEEFDPDAWDHSLSVNLTSAFHTARLSIPHMKAQGWGRIFNISSYYGFRGAENRIDYVTTKTALTGMARAIAIETAKTGITCNAICPGSVGTEAILTRIRGMAADQGRDFDELAREYASDRSATGRFVDPRSIGALLVFLCSDAGADITGATLPVDGGWLAS
jgi:3-hydroxybutyrate dehydrogenase